MVVVFSWRQDREDSLAESGHKWIQKTKRVLQSVELYLLKLREGQFAVVFLMQGDQLLQLVYQYL